MKKISFVLVIVFVASFVFLSAGMVFGQVTGNNGGVTGNNSGGFLSNPLGNKTDLYSLIEAVVNNVIMPIGGVVAALAIIYTGFLFVMARGDEKAISEAKARFFGVVIGTAILLGAWVIANAIKATINQIRTGYNESNVSRIV